MARSRNLTLAAATLSSAWLFAVVVLGQTSHPAGPHRHPEGEQLENPRPATPESIEAGRKNYAFYCAACHGRLGAGDGGQAVAGTTPADLTDEAWDHGASDGEIFLIIRDGGSSPDMQPYSEFLDEEKIWDLVNFIRTLREE